MATIPISKPKLANFDESVTVQLVPVNELGTTFEMDDLVTYGSTRGVDKATGGASDTKLAIAVERDSVSDPYYEPIPSGSAAFGDGSENVQVALLTNQLIEISTDGLLIGSRFGLIYPLAYDSATGTTVVSFSGTSSSGVKIVSIADPLYGGVEGDTNVRILGRLTDDLCL